MMTFRKRTLKDKLLRLWPEYRRKEDTETRAAIKHLVEHPEEPCVIGDTYISDGYGNADSYVGMFW